MKYGSNTRLSGRLSEVVKKIVFSSFGSTFGLFWWPELTVLICTECMGDDSLLVTNGKRLAPTVHVSGQKKCIT